MHSNMTALRAVVWMNNCETKTGLASYKILYSRCWSKSHWYSGIIAKTIGLSRRRWRDCDARVPLPSSKRSEQDRPLIHGQCSPKETGSMSATVQCGSSSPNGWTQFERFRWALLGLVCWTRKCVDRTSRSCKTPSCWPSRRRERADLDCALEPLPVSNSPRDAEIRSVCELAL